MDEDDILEIDDDIFDDDDGGQVSAPSQAASVTSTPQPQTNVTAGVNPILQMAQGAQIHNPQLRALTAGLQAPSQHISVTPQQVRQTVDLTQATLPTTNVRSEGLQTQQTLPQQVVTPSLAKPEPKATIPEPKPAELQFERSLKWLYEYSQQEDHNMYHATMTKTSAVLRNPTTSLQLGIMFKPSEKRSSQKSARAPITPITSSSVQQQSPATPITTSTSQVPRSDSSQTGMTGVPASIASRVSAPQTVPVQMQQTAGVSSVGSTSVSRPSTTTTTTSPMVIDKKADRAPQHESISPEAKNLMEMEISIAKRKEAEEKKKREEEAEKKRIEDDLKVRRAEFHKKQRRYERKDGVPHSAIVQELTFVNSEQMKQILDRQCRNHDLLELDLEADNSIFQCLTQAVQQKLVNILGELVRISHHRHETSSLSHRDTVARLNGVKHRVKVQMPKPKRVLAVLRMLKEERDNQDAVQKAVQARRDAESEEQEPKGENKREESAQDQEDSSSAVDQFSGGLRKRLRAGGPFRPRQPTSGTSTGTRAYFEKKFMRSGSQTDVDGLEGKAGGNVSVVDVTCYLENSVFQSPRMNQLRQRAYESLKYQECTEENVKLIKSLKRQIELKVLGENNTFRSFECLGMLKVQDMSYFSMMVDGGFKVKVVVKDDEVVEATKEERWMDEVPTTRILRAHKVR